MLLGIGEKALTACNEGNAWPSEKLKYSLRDYHPRFLFVLPLPVDLDDVPLLSSSSPLLSSHLMKHYQCGAIPTRNGYRPRRRTKDEEEMRCLEGKEPPDLRRQIYTPSLSVSHPSPRPSLYCSARHIAAQHRHSNCGKGSAMQPSPLHPIPFHSIPSIRRQTDRHAYTHTHGQTSLGGMVEKPEYS